ncbi:MAG: hypothetical protein AABW87_01815 [Nanoarchaeota archaeon]
MLKRGVTPLLMTIILVGFSVAVVTVVVVWSTGYVKEVKEKQGGVAGSRLDCATDIQIAVNNVQISGGSATVDVENLKENVDALFIIFRGGLGQDSVEVMDTLYEGDLKTFDVDFNIGKSGDVGEVDVIPRIKIAPGVYEACSGQHEVFEL